MFKRRKPEDGPDETASVKVEVGMPSPDPFKQSTRPAEPVAGAGIRPVPKETMPMGRTPYPTPPQPTPPIPAPGPGAPQAQAARLNPQQQPARNREPGERRTLIVGRGISVQGTVQDAERLVVEGTVEASMIRATELNVAQGGVFKGAVEVEEAEIAGTIDGTLTARGNLIVRATGKLLGTANYRRLQVEDGGQISGELKMITEPPRAAEPVRSAAESAAG